ncbi:MAG: serine hydrolase [Phenylobacterium sp. RIFCSPHIGHO2_01_FULL_69_31]|jgi:CubicO group peptidase (beta-lactamase class C family)|uniref:serine hydrolase domain-containing protein n=1 Tax=Phenylobacterium sp. RIFCSPHIGHO2_01_FULL_69_31 TaxID=1801944 RepID=UPI0008C7ADAA|nr:serine hydrolase [Phenylobacterium sp. RIFCSPHIGHO2_01_FULL_69_31]OHB31642.1 MAG: serine hydrolase [Phenylobacterium sp. RIFCSPHIGHO2_01_FULL_69_31]
MRRVLGLAVAAALAGSAAHAQVPIRPNLPSILVWTPQQQADWYKDIESVYRVETVKRGDKVHPLPLADRQIDFRYEYGGKTWSVDDYMKAYNVSGVIVLKDGKVLLERYGLGRKPEDRWTSFSVAKSVTSTLVGAAIQDGKIKSLNAPVTDYIPELKGSGYDGVTVRQLLMMSSGVKWNEDYTDPKSDVAQSTALPLEPGKNPLVTYMSRLPRAHTPGTMFNYNTGETDLVGILVSNAVGKSLSQYASEKLWKPYGMERDAIWMVDPAGHERGGCCLSITLRDYARVGQFILDGGVADGQQILPPGWTAEATTPQITSGTRERGYGYFWWMPDSGAFEARGIFGQSITVFRDERIVIVTNAAWPNATGRELSMARNAFLAAARAAANAM